LELLLINSIISKIGIKAEIGEPKLDAPNKGILVCSVEWYEFIIYSLFFVFQKKD